MIYILSTRGIVLRGPEKGDQIVLKQFQYLSSQAKSHSYSLKIQKRFSLRTFIGNVNLKRILTARYSLRTLSMAGICFEEYDSTIQHEVVVLGHYLSSIYIKKYPNGIFHLIDNEYKKNSSYPWKFILHRLDGYLYKRELEFIRSHKEARLLYVTNKDSNYLSNEFSLPLYKEKSISDKLSIVRNPKTLVYWGNLDYIPNRLAVEWLCENSEYLLTKGFTIRVIGKIGKKSLIRKMVKSKIDYRGFVEDLNVATEDCGLFIAPMWSGSGVQNKILEALLLGIPCLISDYLAAQFEWPISDYVAVSNKSNFIEDLVDVEVEDLKRNMISGVEDNFSLNKSLISYKKIFNK